MFRIVASLALFTLSSAFGQTQFASVRGVVQDGSGAVLTNATLTLTNIEQNRPWVTASNESGAYVFQQIPPGNYKLEVQAQGFKRFTREGLTLQVAQIAELNIAMELGAVTESVQVTGETPLLETASSTLGEVVNSVTSENLPFERKECAATGGADAGDQREHELL